MSAFDVRSRAAWLAGVMTTPIWATRRKSARLLSIYKLTHPIDAYINKLTNDRHMSTGEYAMSVKQAVRRQYHTIVDETRGKNIERPAEGWIRTVRKALGMSGAQLAERMGVTRARIAQAEKAELEGGATLRSMQAAAEAMGCRFVYTFVPPDSIENVIIAQARKKAQAIVDRAGAQMALENQAVADSRTRREVTRLMNELIHEMPPDFWDGK